MGRLNRLDSRTAIPQLEQMISEATAKVDELNNLLVDLDKLKAEIATKQPELISGKNIKTVNNNSLLGSGNIDIQGGGGGGTSDHSQLSNRDLPNQHPISAITNLQTSLNNKSNTGHTHEQYITEEEDPTVPDWAKEPTKPTYTAEEVGALPDDTVIPTVPTNVSAFTNDAGYITQNIKVLTRTTIPAYSYSAMTEYLERYDEVIIVLNDVTYRYYGVNSGNRYFVATYYNKMEYLRQTSTGSWSRGTLTINNTTSTYSSSGTTAVNGQAVAQALATISVPTKTSELINDSGFVTEGNTKVIYDVTGVTYDDISSYLYVYDDIVVEFNGVRYRFYHKDTDMHYFTSATDIGVAYVTLDITNRWRVTSVITPTKTSDVTNDSGFVTESDLSDVAFSGDYNDLVNQPTIPSETTVEQVLTSGTEIAKVNGTSLFAPQGGGGDSDYVVEQDYLNVGVSGAGKGYYKKWASGTAELDYTYPSTGVTTKVWTSPIYYNDYASWSNCFNDVHNGLFIEPPDFVNCDSNNSQFISIIPWSWDKNGITNLRFVSIGAKSSVGCRLHIRAVGRWK